MREVGMYCTPSYWRKPGRRRWTNGASGQRPSCRSGSASGRARSPETPSPRTTRTRDRLKLHRARKKKRKKRRKRRRNKFKGTKKTQNLNFRTFLDELLTLEHQ